MAKIFLDANVFIDLMKRDKSLRQEIFQAGPLYLSPISIIFYCYSYHLVMPDPTIAKIPDFFQIVPFDSDIIARAASEKHLDFEDNVQLHSAAITDCDYFLTQDQQILNLKYFGKVQILRPQELKKYI